MMSHGLGMPTLGWTCQGKLCALLVEDQSRVPGAVHGPCSPQSTLSNLPEASQTSSDVAQLRLALVYS